MIKKEIHSRKDRHLFPFLICLLLSAGFLTACNFGGSGSDSQALSEAPEPSPTPLPDFTGVRISEVMTKNTATLLKDGGFPDWIELHNVSDTSLPLDSLVLSDGAHSCDLPTGELAPDEYLLLFCGKDEDGVSFSLSEQDTVTLYAPDSTVLSSCSCSLSEPDASLTATEEGFALCRTPTPGFSNDDEGYEAFRFSQESPSPLRINEVFAHGSEKQGTCDWVELLNVGERPVSLSDYALTDEPEAPMKCRLPERSLAPGEYYVCELNGETFSLGCEESLYLTLSGSVIDCVALGSIPTCGSIGRESDRGWFLYAKPSPKAENTGGFRSRVSAPTLNCPDGVYTPGEVLELTLSGDGDIFYTLDCTHPTEKSLHYTDPITVSSNTVLRAVCFRDGCLPSEAATFSFFFTDVTLPVVSLVGDDPKEVEKLKKSSSIYPEIPAVLSFYEEDGSFTVLCGVRLTGNSSIKQSSKSFSVFFRSCFGSNGLEYDVFDTGVTNYHSLRLRRGYESWLTVYKNELVETLARSFTDVCPIQNSRFVRMYINGSYWGLVSMRDDFSATYFSEYYGGKKSSVEYFRFPVDRHSEFYQEVMLLCRENPDSGEYLYEQLSAVIDMDSLIDWLIVKGLAGDTDYFPNIACYRSSGTGYKWRFCLWDFDCAGNAPFCNMLSCYDEELFSLDLARLVNPLFSSEQFRSRFLSRLDEAIEGPFSKERILPLMDEYEELLREEVRVDHKAWGISESTWKAHTATLRRQMTGNERWTYMLRNLKSFPKMKNEDLSWLLPDETK